jgi:hypothetical protein
MESAVTEGTPMLAETFMIRLEAVTRIVERPQQRSVHVPFDMGPFGGFKSERVRRVPAPY